MENITLHNYRCFKMLPLTFAKKVNLLIGDNSSGKTTLIRAISTVLNSFFVGFSDENTRFSGLSKEDFRIIEGESSLVTEEPIKVNFQLLGVESSLELRSKKSRTLQTPLDLIYKLGNKYKDELFEEGKQKLALPLFTSFSTSDIKSVRKVNKEKFKKYDHKPSFGYYECLHGDGFLDYWTKRLLVLREARKKENEISCVRKAVIDALGAEGCNIIEDMQVRHNIGKIYYVFTDQREVDTEHLSDGYRRLLNIVLDIAFRCVLLNGGIYGEEACKSTTGTVLIDEIDLHLHPSLQSDVIKGLQNAFPQLQFIITSHAPMVMTGIPADEDNKIIKLDYSNDEGYTAKEIKTYGLDASTIIENVLHVVPRSEKVDEDLDILFGMIDNDEYENAKMKLESMQEQFGDTLPELARANAMLNFLTGKSDDQNK